MTAETGSGQPCYGFPVLSVDVVVPDFRFEVLNEVEAVQTAAQRIAAQVRGRAVRGIGAHGRLPQPKDGGRALNASGQFAASIQAVQAKRNKAKWMVKPVGPRTNENVKTKKRSARRRTRAMRRDKIDAFKATPGSGELDRKQIFKALGLRNVRVRTADTNAALAGILSVEPKDKRGISGNRGVYRVLEATDKTRKIGRDTLAKAIKYRLRGK